MTIKTSVQSTITSELSERIKITGRCPYLFVGSGFSRRYIETDDWIGLLKRFSTHKYEYYRSKSENNLALTATHIAADYFDRWWKDPEFKEEREKWQEQSDSQEFPLKASISEHVTNKTNEHFEKLEHTDEIETLKNARIDGIITTNWDLLLERLFPDYKVLIGQEEMILSGIQNIGEIFKIHGCATSPKSLVLTDKDYSNFDSKNPYLAAKLLTIFVEHPVIFIGYSLQDPNIRKIIQSICDGVSGNVAEKVFRNIFFVNRIGKNRSYGIHRTLFNLPSQSFETTTINTDDFNEVFSALTVIERKIPAKILRACQEQFYNIIKSSNPEKRIYVASEDEVINGGGIEFVIGIGIKGKLGDIGYAPISSADIFSDLLIEDRHFDPEMILNRTLPNMQGIWLPPFKYLKAAGIDSEKKYQKSKYRFKIVEFSKEKYSVENYRNTFDQKFGSKTLKQIIASFKDDADKASYVIPCMKWGDIDLELLRSYIVAHINTLNGKAIETHYRKLACIYDRMKYGWPQIKAT